jgi:hypothetical protein
VADDPRQVKLRGFERCAMSRSLGARGLLACLGSQSRLEMVVDSERQLGRVAVCHDGLVSDSGQIRYETTRNGISRDKGADEEEYNKKMAASDAIDRMQAAPREEKRGEAWLEGRQSAGLRGQSLGAMKIALQDGENYQ